MNSSKRTVLVIDDVLPEFEAIKSGLELVYKVVPKENFSQEVFNDTNCLFKQIDNIIEQNKDSLVGIILDANLKDHQGNEDDMSGVTEILPAIRNKGDVFSIIPIIILTKYPSLKRETFNNLGNYFIEKQSDLGKQVKQEVRWVLSSLSSIYEISTNRLNANPYHYLERGIEELKEKLDMLVDEHVSISDILDGIYSKIVDLSERQEIMIYSILCLLPLEKSQKILDKAIEKISSEEIKLQLNQLKEKRRWHNIVKCLLVELGFEVFIKIIWSVWGNRI